MVSYDTNYVKEIENKCATKWLKRPLKDVSSITTQALILFLSSPTMG